MSIGSPPLPSPCCKRRRPGSALRRALLALLVLAPIAGCATAPPKSDVEAYAEWREINDPLEPFNRGVFEFNRFLDALFLKPLAEFYKLLLPPPVQTGVHNVLTNLRAPVTLINDLLQGETTRAGTTASRFLINSTLGVGGFVDWAAEWGMPSHDEDFGQTLAVWGVGEGPYLVLPLLGPSNPRDAFGIAVDSAVLDPFGILASYLIWNESELLRILSFTRAGLTAVDARARNYDALNDIEKNSLDFYATMRSLSRQFRAAEIRNGRPNPVQPDGPLLD